MKKIYRIDLNCSDKGDFTFNVCHMGYFVRSKDSRNYSDLKIEDYVKCLQPDSKWLTANVNKIYRLPHLQLSRDKLSMLQEKCKFKNTRKIDDADLVIVGKNTIEKLTKTNWAGTSKMDTNIRSRLVSAITSSKIDEEHKTLVIKQLDSIESDAYFTMSSCHYYYHDKNDYTKFHEDFLNCLNVKSNYLDYIPLDMYDSYNSIMNSNYDFVSDEHMNKLCTEDSVVLTKETFKNIHKLITSPDKENVTVGMTMMANCNEEESKTYLALLFAFDSENMKVSNIWNTVNFKSLKKLYEQYINLQLGQWGNAYDHLIKWMCKDKCLTIFASRVIANTMFKRVLSGYSGAGTRESVFTLSASDLKLKPEFADQIVSDVDTNLVNVIDNAGSHNDLPF
tara:strand:- start:11424 stop:12602 length:1179 start_codon:yes stop_codon:yes gene_type:complete